MKRIGDLFERVTDFETLRLATKKAMQGCGRTLPACRFAFDRERELLRLQEELRQGTYRPGGFHFFTVRDPKTRLIAVAPFRDRVVHHAVVHVLTPIYEPSFIFDSYATRQGKGTHAAIRRTQEFARRWPWFLKADVHKYFDSVDHDVLLSLLARKVKDRALLALLERIVRNSPRPGRGLPIGNLTSQFLANVYLDPLDHEVKDQLGVRGYVRYMDDFVAFAETVRELKALLARVEDFLGQRLRLAFKPGGVWFNRSLHGLSFLGMRIFPGALRLRSENRRRSLKRMRGRIRAWEAGYLEEDRLAQSLLSVEGHLRAFCPGFPLRTAG